MAENWNCHHCDAVNHLRRIACWQCGNDRGVGVKTSGQRTSQGSPIMRRSLILVSVAIVLISGLLLVPFWMDQRNYRHGVQAFEDADCPRAIGYFDKIIDGWRLVDFREQVPFAMEKRAACLAFMAAADKHHSGEYGTALVSYRDFVRGYPNSPLTGTAFSLAQMLFTQVETLADQRTCINIDSFTDAGIITDPDTHLPLFYLACGGFYDAMGDQAGSYQMYTAFLSEYPQHPLATEAISALALDPQACQQIETLIEKPESASQSDLIPLMYFGCGKTYDREALFGDSYLMYVKFLVGYPEHELAPEVEKILLDNSAFCDFIWLTQGIFIGTRDNFMANHYYRCGQASEEAGEYAEALVMYDHFLDNYADHQLVEKVQAAYASIIVDDTKASKARELGDPQLVGSTGKNHASLSIYNASPDKLRIVLSGPDSHVDELAACESCRTYSKDETSGTCPEDVASETYKLAQGDYDVVIEPSDDNDASPFAGEWDLLKGEEYSVCIVLVKNE